MEEKLEKIKQIVEEELAKGNFCSGHQMDHIMRVYNLAMEIAKDDLNVDVGVLQAAILLHDIAGVKEQDDPTGKTDHAVLGAEMAKPILESLEFSEDKIKHIQNCIVSHRYKTNNKPETLEAKILFDADKLETIGAIGIARAFTWVGRNNAYIYKNPDNINEYIKSNLSGEIISGRIKDKTKHSPQIEFEIKQKFLCDSMHTEKAKEICKERLNYYKKFLDRLEREIRGEV